MKKAFSIHSDSTSTFHCVISSTSILPALIQASAWLSKYLLLPGSLLTFIQAWIWSFALAMSSISSLPCYSCLNLNEILLLLLAGKSMLLLLLSSVGSFSSIAIHFLMSSKKHHYILMSLLALYVWHSSFISTQFLFLHLDGWFVVSCNKFIIFWYSFISLSYYINIRLLIICCHFSGDIYFSPSFVTASKLLCGTFFETSVALSAIVLPIKSSVASAVFWIALF